MLTESARIAARALKDGVAAAAEEKLGKGGVLAGVARESRDRDLLAAMSHFGEGPHLTLSLAEAELIAALCFSSEHGERSFCASLGEGACARRLRAFSQPARR